MVTGTEGWMEIPIAVWPSASIETRIRIRGKADLDDSNIEEIRIPPANQYEHEIVTFSRVVRGLLPQPWPIDNAVAGMRILDAIRLSCARGERVIFEC
jgi:predicted dehydrogenase